MNGKLLKVITSILIILTMTIGNFALLFANAITYAANASTAETSTNNRNVGFSAVLQNAEGKEGADLEVGTDENDVKLHMQVSVMQEGYLEGTIELNTANFTLKPDILSEGITKIEGNTITLSQINAGETRDLLVEIEPNKEEAFNLSLLNMESSITLKGIYRDSSEKDIEIEGTREVKLELVSPYNEENTGNILKQEMITNKVITEDGENKRIIQMEIETGLEGNLYPIEEDRIEIETPKIEEQSPERVEVSTMEELVINGKKIEENSWEYNEEEGKVVIDIKNEAENNIVSWQKEGNNKIIVTYVYNTEAEIEKQEIEVNSEINLYDNNNTVIRGNYRQEIIQEERDNIVRLEVTNKEDEIYKGKIQEGIEREIAEEVGIEITAKGIANRVQVEEDNSEINLQNVYARRTTLNKEETFEVLGEAGTLTIYNADTNVIIQTITVNTEADENGNIVVEYPENVERLRFEINNAENAGRINLENTKIIGENNRNLVEEATNINYILNGKYYIGEQENSVENKRATINLLNTETVANLEVNKTELSTMTENTGVEIRVVLQSNNEKYDLYTNPRIRIELPEVVQEINVNSINLLYAENEMQIIDPVLDPEQNIIEMTLQGKEQSYKDEAIEGPTLIINANLTLDKKAGNSTEQIRLSYTNENATTYEGGATEGVKTADIAVKSYAGVITTTELDEYGLNVINNEGTKTARLELSAESKTATLQGGVINNNEAAISNVRIIGAYPTKDAVEGNNLDIEVSDITAEGIDTSRIAIYYTENAQATDDVNDSSNGWGTEITDARAVKKYMIVVDRLDVLEEVSFSYNMTIPENLEYNYTAKQGYSVNYTESNSTEQSIALDLLTLETGVGPIVDTTLKVFNGTQEITEATLNSYVKYQLVATNTGSEIVTNLSLIGQIPEGTIYVEDKTVGEEGPDSATDEVQTGIIEYPDRKTIEYTIDTLSPGESVTREYMVKTVEAGEITNSVETRYGEVAKKSNEITLNVKDGKLDVQLTSLHSGPVISEGYSYGYNTSLINTSNETLQNVKVKVNTGDIPITSSLVTIWDESENLVSDNFEQSLDNNNEITIGELLPKNKISIRFSITPNLSEMEADKVNIYTQANVESDENTYYSNVKETTVKTIILSIDNTSETSGNYVSAGDEIIYNIRISNKDQQTAENVILKDELPQYVTLVEVKQNGTVLTENDYTISKNAENNTDVVTTKAIQLQQGETVDYEIKVNVDADINIEQAEELINNAKV